MPAADAKATILVVDDNLDNVEILRAFLESRGYAVAEAPEGSSALAKLDEVRPEPPGCAPPSPGDP